jgi:hypothetical protein
VGRTAEPKVLALVQLKRFRSILWHLPCLERIQGVIGGVPRGPSCGTPTRRDPSSMLAGLPLTQHRQRALRVAEGPRLVGRQDQRARRRVVDAGVQAGEVRVAEVAVQPEEA